MSHGLIKAQKIGKELWYNGKDVEDLIADLRQDQKDFPHIAQDIQVAIDHEGGNMGPEQTKHMRKNIDDFCDAYADKYQRGQLEHGGLMVTMGAYQALENAEEEVLDQWSYVRQIRKVLDEIDSVVKEWAEASTVDGYRLANCILDILNRQKDDGEKK